MNADEQFFYNNAGYSYDPATETPEQGRQRCAQALAAAEAWAQAEGMTVQWADDWADPHGHEETPESCEQATLYDADGFVVASLGCIDDVDPDYRRVVEAELAAEAKAEADRWQTDTLHPGACPGCAEDVRHAMNAARTNGFNNASAGHETRNGAHSATVWRRA